MTKEQALEILSPETEQGATKHLTKEQAIRVIEDVCKIACECIRESMNNEVKIEWLDLFPEVPSLEEDLPFSEEE